MDYYSSIVGRKIVKVIPVYSSGSFQHIIFKLDNGKILQESDGEFGGNNMVIFKNMTDYRKLNNFYSLKK